MRWNPKPVLIALDLESVLVPEIWPAVGVRHNIPEFARTTRDTGDYADLMAERIRLCSRHDLRLHDILSVARLLQPLPGAVELLADLRMQAPAVIVSDTFYEMAAPLIAKLDYPLATCHNLIVDEDGRLRGYRLREEDSKRNSVRFFQGLGYWVVAIGDSLNDIGMLETADRGLLLDPCGDIPERLTRLETFLSLDEIGGIIDGEIASRC